MESRKSPLGRKRAGERWCRALGGFVHKGAWGIVHDASWYAQLGTAGRILGVIGHIRCVPEASGGFRLACLLINEKINVCMVEEFLIYKGPSWLPVWNELLNKRLG